MIIDIFPYLDHDCRSTCSEKTKKKQFLLEQAGADKETDSFLVRKPNLIFISTERALRLPTTYDNHPANPIPSIHI